MIVALWHALPYRPFALWLKVLFVLGLLLLVGSVVVGEVVDCPDGLIPSDFGEIYKLPLIDGLAAEPAVVGKRLLWSRMDGFGSFVEDFTRRAKTGLVGGSVVEAPRFEYSVVVGLFSHFYCLTVRSDILGFVTGVFVEGRAVEFPLLKVPYIRNLLAKSISLLKVIRGLIVKVLVIHARADLARTVSADAVLLHASHDEVCGSAMCT